MMRGVQPFRHGGGKPEGKEGVQHYHVRGRNPINLYSPRALVRVFLLYPGQMGTGQKCSNLGRQRPYLNICAPKPHRRWGPRLYPVPYCPNAFLFRYNVKHERVCLTNTLHHSKTEQYPYSPRALFRGVLDKLLSRSKTELNLYSPRSLVRCVFDK